MKILSNEKTDTNIVELEIQVSAELLDEAMEEVYKREGKGISVPGFRKGKAPRRIIEKRFGDGVFLEDAVNDLYPKMYSKAIDEAKIEPVAPGDIKIIDASVADGFTFKAIITVKPEVTVKIYKGIDAEKTIYKVTQEQVDEEVGRLQDRGARLVEVTTRPAENGDTATIDFEGFVDEVAFEGGKAEGHQLELGSNSFIAGFEEQIVGKSIGNSFDVNVTFPEEYHAEELAGKPAVFKVTLHEIKHRELPELDDEFAKDVSEFDTLKELKADLKENLEKIAGERSQEELENNLVSTIVENLEGEIPEVMYEGRIDQMVQEFAQRLSQQEMNLELYLQYTGMDLVEFRKTFREQAERQVKIQLALEEIVKQEEIVPSKEDLDKEYARLAELYQMEEKQIREIIPEENISSDTATGLAIDFIRENAKVTEVEAKEKEVVADEKETEEEDEAESKNDDTEKKD